MISVAAKDRDFLRFLWVDDAVKDEPRIVVYRFARVVFGVNASPFLLNATVRHHLELHADTHREIVSKVIRSIYVDDIVTGSQSEEQAYQLYSEAKTLLKTGSFPLMQRDCKLRWTSRSRHSVKMCPNQWKHIHSPH